MPAMASRKLIMKHLLLASLMAAVIPACPGLAATGQGAHLFVLSGQSNMAELNPEESFAPAVRAEFGRNSVIVVKDALGGQPIRCWYRKWKPAQGNPPKVTGLLYDQLMNKVRAATRDRNITTVTFIWMHGERDAAEKQGEVYEASLKGLIEQLQNDLGRDDLNVVIGRISDFDLGNQKYPHWTMVREAQVKVAESNPRYAWVDTDDLNDGKNRKGLDVRNDLLYSAEGFRLLGERFAARAIALIKQQMAGHCNGDR